MSIKPAVSILDIYAARLRLSRHLRPTPLLRSAWLSAKANAAVDLKIESIQATNAFKIRGALNAALKLLEDRHTAGTTGEPPLVVTASAGNHGRALALAGETLGLRVIVFTPKGAPETKKVAIRRHGAELRDDPVDYDAAEQRAREFAQTEGAVFVSPYNHPDVIAGAGTIGLEILEARPALDTVVIPVGGGGLISGVGLALKTTAPHVRVVGVEVQASTPFATSLAQGAITEIQVGHSLADGLTGNLEPGSITFQMACDVVDEFVSVSEEELSRAIRGLAAEEHLIAEGAGATATAAVLAHKAVKPGAKAAVICSGGNIDLNKFRSVLALD